MQKRYNQDSPNRYFANGINGLPNVILKTFSISPSVSGKEFWNLTVGKDGDLNLGSFGEWTITALDTFSATVKMWGAGGARGYNNTQSITSTSNQGNAGSGGYATATISFVRGQKYIIRVGQGGARTTTTDTGATYLAGGVGNSFGGTQGGGYTGLFYDSVSQANILLLTGGGGGGGDSTFTGSSVGGAGGGATGGNSAAATSQGGSGGSQLAGGIVPATPNGASAGSALQGGQAQTTQNSQASLGGGGGGYFGGGGGNVGGGGGGSGRIGLYGAVTSATLTAGSGNTPGNSADADRGGAGQGGNATIGNTGTDGRLLIRL